MEIIKVEGLRYSYPDGRDILDGVTFTVEEGECFGIIGPNGAGKTTLLLNLLGILKGRGNIEILGEKLNKKNLNKIRRDVGFVFQDPDVQLFSSTLFDDIAFGPYNLGLSPSCVEKRVHEALSFVGLSGYEKRVPHHLSIGEKRRAAIATVLAMKPKVLLLDEPSSFLDPRMKRELIKLLNNMNITKIIVSHDFDFMSKVCSRVAVLYKGKIAYIDKPESLFKNEKLLFSFGL